jgi:hypothetical protein
MPQSTSEIAFAVSVLTVDVSIFGTAIIWSAYGRVMFGVALLSLLLVGFGAVVLLFTLGYRERADIAKRKRLAGGGLVLCGLMVMLTPHLLIESWAFPIPLPMLLDYLWTSSTYMTWYMLLIFALFAVLGGLIIERAGSSAYSENGGSRPHTTTEVVLAVGLMSLLMAEFGPAVLLSALGTSRFVFAVSILGLLVTGFGGAALLLALGQRETADVARRRLLIKAGLVLSGLMIILTPLSLYEFWAFPDPPSFPGNVLAWVILAAPMRLYDRLALSLFAALGGFIIQRAWSRQCEAGS